MAVVLNYDPAAKYLVSGDSGLLSQATINLLANAIKFSASSKEINISLRRVINSSSRNRIILSIKDQGIGIPPDEISKLSERFYRASNAVAEHVPGTGLGLAIVAKVVELHGADKEAK